MSATVAALTPALSPQGRGSQTGAPSNALPCPLSRTRERAGVRVSIATSIRKILP